MNLFLGIPIPAWDIKTLIEMILAEHPDWQTHPAIRWTSESDHHLTVHFFGAIDPGLLGDFIADLDGYIRTVSAFSIKINQLSNFPKANSDLIAAYVELSNPLAKLHQQVEQAVADHQFPTENRAYSPHITLCRGKRRQVLKMEPIVVPNHPINITQLVLYQSQPTANDSQYTPLHQWAL